MVIKWTVKNVIEAFEDAIKTSPNQDGNNQLLQQLLNKRPNKELNIARTTAGRSRI